MKLPVSTFTAPTEKRQLLAVEQIEIHQLHQRLAQGRGVVIAGGVLGAGRQEPGIDLVRREEAGLADSMVVKELKWRCASGG